MKSLFSTTFNTGALNFWLLIFRIAVGILMLTHGWPKFQMLMVGNPQFADPIGLGVTTSLILVIIAEVLCSILIILGFATRIASLILIINMSVAVFVAHANDVLAKKELPILFLLIFITLLVTGSGKYGLDALIGKKRYR